MEALKNSLSGAERVGQGADPDLTFGMASPEGVGWTVSERSRTILVSEGDRIS